MKEIKKESKKKEKLKYQKPQLIEIKEYKPFNNALALAPVQGTTAVASAPVFVN